MPLRYLLLLLVLNFGETLAQESESFTLVKKDSSIYLYERWVSFPGKVPAVRAREVKGEFLVRASMYKVLSIIKDESQVKYWQKHVSKFKIYPQRDTSNWLEYSYHDIPWPVSDQDHFLKYDLIEKIPARELFIKFESVINPKLAPVESGVSRMELRGSWTLEQISPQQAKVTYRILSMPSSIPRMFTDPVIRNNLMSTIKALTKLSEEK
jgi:hypothetical protein